MMDEWLYAKSGNIHRETSTDKVHKDNKAFARGWGQLLGHNRERQRTGALQDAGAASVAPEDAERLGVR